MCPSICANFNSYYLAGLRLLLKVNDSSSLAKSPGLTIGGRRTLLRVLRLFANWRWPRESSASSDVEGWELRSSGRTLSLDLKDLNLSSKFCAWTKATNKITTKAKLVLAILWRATSNSFHGKKFLLGNVYDSFSICSIIYLKDEEAKNKSFHGKSKLSRKLQSL